MTQEALPEGTDAIIDDAAASDTPAGAGAFGGTTGSYVGSAPAFGAADDTGGAAPGGGTAGAKPSIDDAKATIGDAKAKIGETATGLKGQAADKAREYAVMGKDRATEALHNVSRMIDDAAATVDDKVGAQYGDYARQASQTVKNFAASLEGADVDELFEQGRDFVKKSPGVAVGAAAAIGFVVARIVKAGLEPATGGAAGEKDVVFTPDTDLSGGTRA